MLKDVPVSIDREFQFIVLDRTPDGFTIETEEERRRLSENYSWRLALQARNVFRIDGALINVRQHAIEGDDTVVLRYVFFEFANDLLGLFF